jgi:hypothetical protein
MSKKDVYVRSESERKGMTTLYREIRLRYAFYALPGGMLAVTEENRRISVILHVARNYCSSGDDPAFYLMDIAYSFMKVKQPEREDDHSPASSTEVKIE